jgi:hypothetical protein
MSRIKGNVSAGCIDDTQNFLLTVSASLFNIEPNIRSFELWVASFRSPITVVENTGNCRGCSQHVESRQNDRRSPDRFAFREDQTRYQCQCLIVRGSICLRLNYSRRRIQASGHYHSRGGRHLVELNYYSGQRAVALPYVVLSSHEDGVMFGEKTVAKK